MPGYSKEAKVTGTKAVVGSGGTGIPRDTGGGGVGQGRERG